MIKVKEKIEKFDGFKMVSIDCSRVFVSKHFFEDFIFGNNQILGFSNDF